MSRRYVKLIHRIGEEVGHWFILLLGYTVRISRINPEAADRLYSEGKPHIYCLWHGRMFLPIFVQRQRGIVAMISQHADGEMITRVVKKLGYGTVRGSSKQGGSEAFHEMVSLLTKGGVGAMLPDGPTGPRHHFKPGTLYLASRAGCPLIPLTFAASSCWRFKSWDRFIIPIPFARCAVFYGDPINVPAEIPEDEVETWRKRLEDIMIDLVKSAEAHFGRSDEYV